MRFLTRLVALLALAAPLAAQAPAPRYIQFIFAPAVRDSLATAWDDTVDPNQNERAYCLTGVARRTDDDGIRVDFIGFIAPDSLWPEAASPYSVGFTCPAGTVKLHTHTPTTCPVLETGGHDAQHCAFGGEDAWLCFPSPTDQDNLARAGISYAFVQCDKHAILAYQASRKVGR